MKPSEALAAHRDELRRIIARHGVLRPRVFGSVVHGDDTDESDLDLLVDASNTTTLLTLAAVQIEAEKLLGIPVDVRTAQDISKRFREEVLSEALPV
jgi:predicted nucleotidyltransferase